MESITNVRRPLLYYSVIYSLRRFSVSDKAADVSVLGSTNPLFKSEIENMDKQSREVLEKVIGYMEKKYISGPMKLAKEIIIKNAW